MNTPLNENDLKKRNLRGLLRLFLFGVCFLLILVYANFHFIETDLISGATVREMQSRDDIEIAFVGSSVVLFHFNPAIVEEETGLTSYNCAIHSASLQGDITLIEEMFKTNSPRYVVLALEPYTFNSAKESLEAEYRMAPFLTGAKTLIDYYLSTTRTDHRYLDRALLIRDMKPNSLGGIIKTYETRRDASQAIQKYADRIKPGETYLGSGYIRHSPDPEGLHSDLRVIMYRDESDGDYYPLLPDTISLLEQFRSSVEAHGASLILILCPNHTSHPLAVPSYLPYSQSMMNYCKEQGIPCFNFQYAKPELMPCLDDYFYDVYHMCGEGADILTRTFCRVFTAWQSGEDVSDLFYPNAWMYQDSLHCLTNTWLWPDDENGFVADSNHDWYSIPEYKYVYVDEDGTETLLKDYTEDTTLDAEYPGKGNLRVYARIKGEAQNPAVYFDYPADFSFAERMLDF
ncbi:MAG: hypothetical protein IJT77_12695 [Clostridia bacterium]|nr:hypothetical protein [Clostridia bacterium]